jgi:hypothetical protein
VEPKEILNLAPRFSRKTIVATRSRFNSFGDVGMLQNLYHADVFLPRRLKRPVFEGNLTYSAHALAEAENDRYGRIPLPAVFVALNATLIEVETAPYSGEVRKQVWRMPLDENRDIVLVFGCDGFVRTVWFNERRDTHKTLNRSRYVRN